MTEYDEEPKGTLAERLAAHTRRVHVLLHNVDPFRDGNGDAPAEMTRPEKRIDGTLRSQRTPGTAGPGEGRLDPPLPSGAVDSTFDG